MVRLVAGKASDGSAKVATIREGVTVHRGTGTVIGDGCLLMTNSHIGHNCEIGRGVTIVNGALLAGYVRVGPGATISGNAAIHQFVRIGELAMVSGLARQKPTKLRSSSG